MVAVMAGAPAEPGRRQECELSTETEVCMEDSLESEISLCIITEGIVSLEQWVSAVVEDDVLQRVCKKVNEGWSNAKCEKELEGFGNVKEELSVDGGVLLRGSRLVVPARLREKIMDLGHEGHQGMSKTKARIRLNYWWPGMDLMIKRKI
ncbi:hypothetical protein NDU88_004136 [Pleurodeles waltl]|uniref:Gypsy retrotransposon integrase-like protein 1 n=1 Tax=Pleurodeles waltl TaxID=8319 RepID=A0AAV7UEH6_PLEWA|nr:hypothetical protein NDU88_004136 [Pleurodeles waltl]